MREIEDARAALDRVENNLERYRWILRNPTRAMTLLQASLTHREDEMALDFVHRLDAARLFEAARNDAKPPFTVVSEHA